MTPRKTPPQKKDGETQLEYLSFRATRWVGSTNSLIVHTLFFIGAFLLHFLGVNFEFIFLVVTTLVSLEAIYLAIFIQMSVNRQGKHLREVAKDVDEIQEDIGEIQENIDEIQEDVDEIQEDVDEIQEDVEEITEDETKPEEKDADKEVLEKIESSLRELGKEIAELKRRTHSNHGTNKNILGE